MNFLRQGFRKSLDRRTARRVSLQNRSVLYITPIRGWPAIGRELEISRSYNQIQTGAFLWITVYL